MWVGSFYFELDLKVFHSQTLYKNDQHSKDLNAKPFKVSKFPTLKHEMPLLSRKCRSNEENNANG